MLDYTGCQRKVGLFFFLTRVSQTEGPSKTDVCVHKKMTLKKEKNLQCFLQTETKEMFGIINTFFPHQPPYCFTSNKKMSNGERERKKIKNTRHELLFTVSLSLIHSINRISVSSADSRKTDIHHTRTHLHTYTRTVSMPNLGQRH